MKFKVGDRVIWWSRYQMCFIQCEISGNLKYLHEVRPIINSTGTFLASDRDLELDKEYYRNQKLNQLGI